jgi:hypothetical protein
MNRRRQLLGAAGALTAAVAAAGVSRAALAALPEPVLQTRPDTMPPLQPATGRPYRPVVTLNGWTLPWRMRDGVKEFHLVAEPVVREMAPGFKAHLWGYNGQSPGPTIEVVEGDRVRTASACPTAWTASPGSPNPAFRRARPSSTSSRRAAPALSCTTRTPTRWCRWPWA